MGFHQNQRSVIEHTIEGIANLVISEIPVRELGYRNPETLARRDFQQEQSPEEADTFSNRESGSSLRANF